MREMFVTMPATEPRAGSDQHDAALALALGALAVARQVELCVARPSPPGSPPLAADDALVVAALGAISIGRSLRRWLNEAAAAHEGPHVAAPAPVPTSRELLR